MSKKIRFGFALSGIALLASFNACVGSIDCAKSAEIIDKPSGMVAGRGATGKSNPKNLKEPKSREDLGWLVFLSLLQRAHARFLGGVFISSCTC
jgi:hypothetical protein